MDVALHSWVSVIADLGGLTGLAWTVKIARRAMVGR